MSAHEKNENWDLGGEDKSPWGADVPLLSRQPLFNSDAAEALESEQERQTRERINIAIDPEAWGVWGQEWPSEPLPPLPAPDGLADLDKQKA